MNNTNKSAGRIRTSPGRAVLVFAAALGAAVTAFVQVPLADPASPMTITNVDSPDPVASGDQLTYTVTMVNTGGSKLTKVVMTDQLNGVGGIGVPPQLQITSSRGSCTQTTTLVTCQGGTIEGNGSWTVTIRGKVTAANGTVINNTAAVAGTRSAQNFNTTTSTTTQVSGGTNTPLADLSISKNGPTSVVKSTPITYTLTVNNAGMANATGVKVVDTLPAGITAIAATGTSLFACTPVGQTVTCVGGAVNQGSNATITINGIAPAVVGTITNNAVVDPDNTIPESNELNNTSALVNTQVTEPVAGPQLTIDKTDGTPAVPAPWAAGAGPDPVNPGQNITYKIHVQNTSSSRADDVRVVDGTQGLVASSIVATQQVVGGTVGNGNGCVVSAPQATCSIRSLNAGGTLDITITGQVIDSAGSTILNTATVTGNISNQGVSATDTEITTVKPSVDLTITKEGSPNPVCAASWPGPGYPASSAPFDIPAGNVCQGGLTYSFVVGNSGNQPATGVVIRDPLPAGVFFDHFTNDPSFNGGFTCSYAAPPINVVTCSGGTVPADSLRKISFTTVAAPVAGAIVNTVTVDPNNAIFEADETNNTFTQTTQVVTGVDLMIAKHSNHEADFVATRGTLTYTIGVSNIGTQDAANIVVMDTLPADTIFRDASGNHGFTCAQSNGTVTCSGGSLKGTESMNYPNLAGTLVDSATITVRIFATAYEQAAMHNEVRVDPGGLIPEANESNNIAVQNTQVKRAAEGEGVGHHAFNQLTISKAQTSPDPTNTARSAVVTYVLHIGNDATDPAVNVKVSDSLPQGARYIDANATGGFTCAPGEGRVVCIGGSVPAGTLTSAGPTITIRAFAPDTPGTYPNQAIVDPDQAIAEGNEFDNAASVQTVVTNGGTGAFNDLQIQKTATASTTPGGPIVYTIKVWNTGSDPAQQVAVRDALPAGVTFVSAIGDGLPGGFFCNEAASVVTCTGATVNGGTTAAAGFRQITINATAPQANGTYTNTAVVDPANTIPEGDESNNTSTDSTVVAARVNLTISKSGPRSSTQASTATYEIKVKNNIISGAGETATGIAMHDPMPPGLIPLGVDTGTGNNWACQIFGNPVNDVACLGDLPPGDEVTVKIKVFLTAESGTVLDNVACVDTESVVTESNEADNCSQFSTTVGDAPKLSPDLLVSKSVNATTTTSGSPLHYDIAISNVGTAKAKSPLTLTDVLSTSLTFLGVTAGNAWTCSQSSGTVTCHDGGTGLAAGESATIGIDVRVKDGTTAPIINTAKADQALVDPSADPCAADATKCEDETADHITSNSSTVTTSTSNSTGFDFAITTITDAPDPVNAGDMVTYTIVAANLGTQGTVAGSPAHVSIQIPPSTSASFIGADGTNGFVCEDPVASIIDCSGDMPAGGQTVITVKLGSVAAAPPTLTLVATIDPADAFVETVEGNNSMTEVTTVSNDVCGAGCVDLVASQMLPSVDPVHDGQEITFLFSVVNTGDTPADFGSPEPPNALFNPFAWFDITSNDATLTFISRTPSNPAVTCSTPSSGATLILSDCLIDHSPAAGDDKLNPGEGVTIAFTVKVTVTGAAPSVTASGQVDPLNVVTGEFLETNNNLTRTVAILP